MARNEDLPYWNPKEMEDDGDHGSAGRFGKGRVAAFALVGLAALLLMVGIGYLLGQSRSNEVATGDGESQLGAEPLDEEAQEQLTEDSAVSNDVDDTPLD